MSNTKLVLIDGHSLAYRAYFALPPTLSTSQGQLTNAIYGFATMLFSVIQEERPTHLIVTFDKGPSFRTREYAEYKAHREKMPDEMRSQLPHVRRLVELLSIPIVELEDFEADDLLGTLARQGEAAGLDVVIVTGDRDALQLVSDRVTVLTSGRRFSDTQRFTPAAVKQKYGLTPEQIIDLKALMGDKSDNIPGVAGVGEKGATTLLQKYGTLEALYAHVDEIQGRYHKPLVEGREQALLSQRLARIVCEAPVTLDLAAAQWQEYDRDALRDFLQTLEFRTLLERLPVPPGAAPLPQGQLSLFGAAAPGPAPSTPVSLGDYTLVADAEALAALATQLRQAERLTLDTETTGTDPLRAELVGLALTDRAEAAWYLPLRAPAGEPTLTLAQVREQLGPILADAAIPKQGHNLKYDLEVLRRAGFTIAGDLFDTMVAEWVLNPASPNLGLKNLAWARLGVEMTPIKELLGSGRDQKTMAQIPLAQVLPYACADADLTHRLAAQLGPELVEREQDALFRELEMALLPALIAMEEAGVSLDLPYLATLSEELGARLAQLEQEIYRAAGTTFNINSTQQLSKVLFEALGLPTRGLRKTKSGHYSTRAEVLEGLRGQHRVVDYVLDYRELSKLKSTYVDALPQLVNPATGRVHTSYNQTGTVTGRFSSSDPNLQNIPIRTEEGRRVRRAFVAAEGCWLVGADYSQVELRVMAHVSEDAGLIEAFQRGEDIHATTAAAVYGTPLEEVTSEMRRVAKAVNFGLIYGQGAYGLAGQLGIAVKEAEAFIERYFARFSKVRAYMDALQEQAAEQGYVETLLGRRRYFPELLADAHVSSQQKQSAQRMAINTPIQGTAADILKRALLALHERLQAERVQSRIILQVHDELVLEVPEAELDTVAALVRETMENAYRLAVPLKVDVEKGRNWEEMTPLS